MILVKSKRNIGFAPPVLAFQTRMEILPVWRGEGGGGGAGNGHPDQIYSPNFKFS